MIRNVPDDWDNYWYKCTRCGQRAHESEQHDCKEEQSYTVSDITIRVHHDEIDDVDLLEQAQIMADRMKKQLWDMFGVPVEVHDSDVCVETSPFKVE